MKALSFLLAFSILELSMPAFAFDHSHSKWGIFLKTYVVSKDQATTVVDYEKAKASHTGLDEYLSAIQAVSRSEYDKWTSEQKKAFLINAYNALTVHLILREKTTPKSIKDLGHFWRSAWKIKFFKFF